MIRIIPLLCLLVFGVSFSDPVKAHSRHQCRDLCGDAGVKSGEWVPNAEQDGCWHQEGHIDCVCNGEK
jgi:hypothetical protein